MWTINFPMFKLVLEKEEELVIKLPTFAESSKKQELQKKNIYFCFINNAKAIDSVDHNKLENSSRDGNTRPPYLPLKKSVYRSRSNRTRHGTIDWFQIGKGVRQIVYCHHAYLTYMQSTSCEMPG